MKSILFLTPIMAWIIAGSMKFVINSLKQKNVAIKSIGYGGFPSTHSSIVSSVATIIVYQEGIHSSLFILALSVAMVVIIDAMDLRRKIGEQAARLNLLSESSMPKLREQIGHTPLEVIGGLLTGITVATFIYFTSL